MIGRQLIILGIIAIFIGLLLSTGFGRNWIGKLPGDFRIEKKNFTFYFPLATCLLLSLVVTLLLKFWRR